MVSDNLDCKLKKIMCVAHIVFLLANTILDVLKVFFSAWFPIKFSGSIPCKDSLTHAITERKKMLISLKIWKPFLKLLQKNITGEETHFHFEKITS